MSRFFGQIGHFRAFSDIAHLPNRIVRTARKRAPIHPLRLCAIRWDNAHGEMRDAPILSEMYRKKILRGWRLP
jgi:hypothetical protein